MSKRAFTLAEVPEARQDIGSLSNLSRHPEFISVSCNRDGGQIPHQVRDDKTLSEAVSGDNAPQEVKTHSLINLFTYSPKNKPSRGTNEVRVDTETLACRHSVGGGAVPFIARRSVAFTLAEVLITLAIIGVVAAMTIPTVIGSYKKKIVETRLLKIYSAMNQAIKLSEVDNGSHLLWDELGRECDYDEETRSCKENTVEALNWYNKYLSKYLRVLNVDTYRFASGSTKCNIYFSDGSLLSFNKSGTTFFPVASDFEKCEITKVETNCTGTKAFAFSFTKENNRSGFDVFDSKNNSYANIERKMQNCAYETYDGIGHGTFCTYFIKKNGWKIPKDYPLKF